MTHKKSIGERIQHFRSLNGLTQHDLARVADCSKQLVSAWEAGRSEITVESVIILAQRLGIDPRWLLLGDQKSRQSPLATTAAIRHLPYFCAAQLIEGADKIRNGKLSSLQVVSTLHDHPAGCFAMSCTDDAMAPLYRQGDLLVVDINSDLKPNSHVAALIYDTSDPSHESEIVTRRIRFLGGAVKARRPLQLAPENPGWPTLSISTSAHGIILGTVVSRQTSLDE